MRQNGWPGVLNSIRQCRNGIEQKRIYLDGKNRSEDSDIT